MNKEIMAALTLYRFGDQIIDLLQLAFVRKERGWNDEMQVSFWLIGDTNEASGHTLYKEPATAFWEFITANATNVYVASDAPPPDSSETSPEPDDMPF